MYSCSPPSPTVAACTTSGCNVHRLQLQSAPPTVADPNTYGCSLHYLRLQAEAHAQMSSLTFGADAAYGGAGMDGMDGMDGAAYADDGQVPAIHR